MKTKDKSPYLSTISFIHLGIAFLLLTSSACSTFRLWRGELVEDNRAILPQNMKSAQEDIDLFKETSCIVSVNDGGAFTIGKESVAESELTAKITEKMKDKTPDKRIVYIEGTVGAKYQTIVKLLGSIRKADIDKAGLTAYQKDQKSPGARPSVIEVKLPPEPNPADLKNVKPNPLTLVVSVDSSGILRLNNETVGNVGQTNSLTDKLTDIFKVREQNGVFREGTNEIETTVFIKAVKSMNYGDFVRVIDAIKTAGAQPVGVQIDNLND